MKVKCDIKALIWKECVFYGVNVVQLNTGVICEHFLRIIHVVPHEDTNQFNGICVNNDFD